MRIELHQRGGVLGRDRRVLVAGGTIEVTDRGERRRPRALAPEEVERIDGLARSAAAAEPGGSATMRVSDEMEHELAIGERRLSARTGDGSPAEVWALIAELGRLSDR